MILSDYIAVMRDGEVVQYGGPADQVYRKPNHIYVGTFIGKPRMSIMEGRLKVDGQTGGMTFSANGVRIAWAGVPGRPAKAMEVDVSLGIRAEDVKILVAGADGDGTMTGEVNLLEPLGSDTYVELANGKVSITARTKPDRGIVLVTKLSSSWPGRCTSLTGRPARGLSHSPHENHPHQHPRPAPPAPARDGSVDLLLPLAQHPDYPDRNGCRSGWMGCRRPRLAGPAQPDRRGVCAGIDRARSARTSGALAGVVGAELWHARAAWPGGVDIALEDLRGKALGLPVASDGGRLRGKVMAYASAMNYIEGEDPAVQYPREAEALVAQGFQGAQDAPGRAAPAPGRGRRHRGAQGGRAGYQTHGGWEWRVYVVQRHPDGPRKPAARFLLVQEPLPQSVPEYAAYETRPRPSTSPLPPAKA